MKLFIQFDGSIPFFFQSFTRFYDDLLLIRLTPYALDFLTLYSSVARVRQRKKHDYWDGSVADVAVLESGIEI